MTRDWKTRESIENPHYCWEDPILKDEFGITEKDWQATIQQTVKHIRDQMDQTTKARVSCILDVLLPPLQTLWQGKDGKLLFRWLPCRSLKGATVADHALTASAIAYCFAYDADPRFCSHALSYLKGMEKFIPRGLPQLTLSDLTKAPGLKGIET